MDFGIKMGNESLLIGHMEGIYIKCKDLTVIRCFLEHAEMHSATLHSTKIGNSSLFNFIFIFLHSCLRKFFLLVHFVKLLHKKIHQSTMVLLFQFFLASWPGGCSSPFNSSIKVSTSFFSVDELGVFACIDLSVAAVLE